MIAVRAFTVKILEFALAALEFVQEPEELVRYCHWYNSQHQLALTEKVVCVPSAAVTLFGCVVMLGLVTVPDPALTVKNA